MSQLPQNPLIISKQLPIKNQVKAYTILNRKDRTILSSYNENKSLEIASLSKIVTFQVSTIIQELLQLENNFSIFVTKYAASIQGTTAELKQNDCLTLQELYYGIMLPSGNDAATTLAQNLGFLAYMNDKQNESTMALSNQNQKNQYNKDTNILNYITKNYKCQEIKNEQQKIKNSDKNQQSHQIYQEPTLNDLLNQRNQLLKKSSQNQSKTTNNNSEQIIKISQQNQEFDIRTYSTAQHDLGYKYFIKLMNAYVNYSLNLKQTNFQNPHGMFLNQNISNGTQCDKNTNNFHKNFDKIILNQQQKTEQVMQNEKSPQNNQINDIFLNSPIVSYQQQQKQQDLHQEMIKLSRKIQNQNNQLQNYFPLQTLQTEEFENSFDEDDIPINEKIYNYYKNSLQSKQLVQQLEYNNIWYQSPEKRRYQYLRGRPISQYYQQFKVLNKPKNTQFKNSEDWKNQSVGHQKQLSYKSPIMRQQTQIKTERALKNDQIIDNQNQRYKIQTQRSGSIYENNENILLQHVEKQKQKKGLKKMLRVPYHLQDSQLQQQLLSKDISQQFKLQNQSQTNSKIL
ncbi:Beta-lactamase/transpeptidase-like protein [Pseudocohnilembus persalinus]|uniref:Beta-lactamase/transpeptidase-like protein n=1 Tax=Pseudocohnilembus persalinus TaxID=266149 RepID=A0A0V0Q9S7_PSEPJ|nr:Beta-lactamase/transpeptidase-like protein [Pseudocohnilembus persalinus]|eukprot:KRW98988.1 Beta-lactamase/transpeptidase-like protein [Pseudocohnilembus persalinus]